MSGKYSTEAIFSDWVKCFAIAIQNSCMLIHDKIWSKREEEYLSTINKYEKEERMKMSEISNLLPYAFEEEFTDLLGEIYMEAGCGNKATGQFFTPYHLSKATAALSIPADISEENKLKLQEPSTGAGGMIIAAADVLRERGIDYQKCMKVVAQDLDWRAVYMSYIQFSLLGIDAIVVQGSTLAEPYKLGYPEERVFRTPKNIGVLI